MNQRVSVNSTLSDWEDVLTDIPLGSVLGPLLFIIYINYIVNACGDDANIYLFADNAKIHKYITKAEDAEVLQHKY